MSLAHSFKITKNLSCESCLYYLMIDSGYGYCHRYPPKDTHKPVTLWWILFCRHRPPIKVRYQVVSWDNPICGEFKTKGDQI